MIYRKYKYTINFKVFNSPVVGEIIVKALNRHHADFIFQSKFYKTFSIQNIKVEKEKRGIISSITRRLKRILYKNPCERIK